MVHDLKWRRTKLRDGRVWSRGALGPLLARPPLLMARRRRPPTFMKIMAKPILAIAMLGLMWLAIQFDVHNEIGRLIIAPMIPK